MSRLGVLASVLGQSPSEESNPIGEWGPNDPRVQTGGYEVSWQAGSYDPTGQFMGGTELMHLVAHQGVLFAATSVWMDRPGDDPQIGAQILRLDAPGAEWVIDRHYDEIVNGEVLNWRLESMKSVTFTTDGEGNPLSEPVTMLLAAPADRAGRVLISSRDDATGVWTDMVVGQTAGQATQIRSIGMHHDAVTGVDRVFISSNHLGVFSGVYDSTLPGGIRWEEQEELTLRERGMAFAVANGELYLVVKPEMYKRIDGPEPYWELVLNYPPPPPLTYGLRGLTTIPDPDGLGEVMLAGKEGFVCYMVRIQPALNYEYILELHVQDFLRQRWGGLSANFAVAAYNDMTELVDPRTGETIHLIGLLAHAPGDLVYSSWYLIRYADGTYDLRQIPPLPHPTIKQTVLYGTRSIIVSPFEEDAGQVVYFGGYDPLLLPAHNTAWIYKAPLQVVLDGK